MSLSIGLEARRQCTARRNSSARAARIAIVFNKDPAKAYRNARIAAHYARCLQRLDAPGGRLGES